MAAVLATHALAESYRTAQAKIASEAASKVALAFKTLLNPSDLTGSFPLYAQAATVAINDARKAAADAGGAFYLAHRKAAGVLGAMPEIAWTGAVDPAASATSLLVTGPVAVKRALTMGATLPQALATAEVKTVGAAYRHAANAGRGTIKGTIHRDKKALGWARVSDGRPCYFCAMLASRGAVYKSATTAGMTDDGDPYHDNCGCFVVPVYTRDDPIPGLGPELEALWADVQKRKKKGVPPALAWRRAYDEKYPEGTNPSQKIADAQLAAAKAEAAKNAGRAEEIALRDAAIVEHDADRAARAAAKAAEEAERIAQAEAEGMTHPKPKPENLTYVKPAGGSHGAAIYEDTTTGQKWIFKSQVDVGVAIDTATAKLAKLLGKPAADTYAFTLPDRSGYGQVSGTLQAMLPGGDAFPGPDWERVDPEKLSADDLLALQKEHVLDWLFANHDAHKANFVRDADGQLAGIDKGQALKFFGRDRLDWEFFPNEHEPIYNTIYRAFYEGKNVALQDPAEGELAVFIQSVMAFDDNELKALFRPYAEAAAARGWLLTGSHWKPAALEPLTLPGNDVDAFLDALVQRKNSLADDFANLYKRANAERLLKEAAEKEAAEKAAKLAKLEKKWKGKPKPQPPTEPQPPQVDGPRFFDGWLEKVKARYAGFSGGKKLEDSHNWPLVQRVIEEHDLTALESLHTKKYVDWDLYQEAADLFGDVEEAKLNALSDADYLKALRSFKNLTTRYKRYLAEWREVNGVTVDLRGMVDGVARHANFEEGHEYALPRIAVPTGKRRAALTEYTGNSYRPWNSTLRSNNSHDAPSGTWEQWTKDADEGFSPIPEDMIVHRATDFGEFALPDGTRTASLPPPDPRTLIGTVQTQPGYMSTSVGHRGAFYHAGEVQMVIRLPAGHRAAYVQPYSQFRHEMELLVQRQSSLFIHDVYRDAVNGKWIVECEVLPTDADPASFEGLTPMPAPGPKVPPAPFSGEYGSLPFGH
ncbi:ADP-ribosyltransferase [Micromonospora sp. NPDC023956]|uniref:VG15 protein n=1 Tax=Micromonospora sp. NPDC023956 TaxID=3155722 RepID=UPI003406BDB5